MALKRRQLIDEKYAGESENVFRKMTDKERKSPAKSIKSGFF